MDEEESSEREFVQTVLGNFTPMESQMGSEAYNANVEITKAAKGVVEARALVWRNVAALLTVAVIVSLASGVAFIVWAWKAALGS